MRISNSKVDLFNTCSFKYKLRYIDKLKVNKTFSALLFGTACDHAFNYLLLRKKRNKVVHADTAKALFLKYMSEWDGSNELVFFKSELPADDFYEDDHAGNQDRCFAYLCSLGQMFIDTYIEEILPLFKRIIKVQVKKVIKNQLEDEFVLVVDFLAEMPDGRIILFDNKTTSDIKKQYPKTAVRKSQQLALYVEYEINKLAGYICLQKKLVDGKVVWSHIIDEVPEEQSEKAFETLDKALSDIKAEKFDKNEKSCYKFGKPCEYWNFCKYGNKKDLKE